MTLIFFLFLKESGGQNKKKWSLIFFSIGGFSITSVVPPFKESTDHGLTDNKQTHGLIRVLYASFLGVDWVDQTDGRMDATKRIIFPLSWLIIEDRQLSLLLPSLLHGKLWTLMYQVITNFLNEMCEI